MLKSKILCSMEAAFSTNSSACSDVYLSCAIDVHLTHYSAIVTLPSQVILKLKSSYSTNTWKLGSLAEWGHYEELNKVFGFLVTLAKELETSIYSL